jgi:putative oxidoreductase
MIKLFSHLRYKQPEVLAVLRFVIGFMMARHGFEVFTTEKMIGDTKWMNEIHFMFPSFIAYVGKGAEFLSGCLLMIGLFTRLASFVLAITMLTITFGIGQGRMLMEDQHPFLFAVLAVVFMFLGAADYSLEKLFFRKTKDQ